MGVLFETQQDLGSSRHSHKTTIYILIGNAKQRPERTEQRFEPRWKDGNRGAQKYMQTDVTNRLTSRVAGEQ